MAFVFYVRVKRILLQVILLKGGGIFCFDIGDVRGRSVCRRVGEE